MEALKKFQDEKKTAKRIGISHRTVQDMRYKGGGPPFYKIGGRVLYAVDEVDAWLLTKRRVSTSDSGPIAA